MAAETEEMRARRRHRRALFDGVADRYRASRRGYPPESVQFIIDTARLGPGSAVLEVGLFVTPNTLRTHLRAIYRKLGAESREEAVIPPVNVASSSLLPPAPARHPLSR